MARLTIEVHHDGVDRHAGGGVRGEFGGCQGLFSVGRDLTVLSG